MGQQHDGKVRPRRLALSQVTSSANPRHDRLVGDNGQTRTVVDFMHELARSAQILAWKAGLLINAAATDGVPPLRGEDDGPLGGGPGFTAFAPPTAACPRRIDRNAAQNAMKSSSGRTDGQPAAVDAVFADGDFVAPVRFLMTEIARRTLPRASK